MVKRLRVTGVSADPYGSVGALVAWDWSSHPHPALLGGPENASRDVYIDTLCNSVLPYPTPVKITELGFKESRQGEVLDIRSIGSVGEKFFGGQEVTTLHTPNGEVLLSVGRPWRKPGARISDQDSVNYLGGLTNLKIFTDIIRGASSGGTVEAADILSRQSSVFDSSISGEAITKAIVSPPFFTNVVGHRQRALFSCFIFDHPRFNTTTGDGIACGFNPVTGTIGDTDDVVDGAKWPADYECNVKYLRELFYPQVGVNHYVNVGWGMICKTLDNCTIDSTVNDGGDNHEITLTYRFTHRVWGYWSAEIVQSFDHGRRWTYDVVVKVRVFNNEDFVSFAAPENRHVASQRVLGHYSYKSTLNSCWSQYNDVTGVPGDIAFDYSVDLPIIATSAPRIGSAANASDIVKAVRLHEFVDSIGNYLPDLRLGAILPFSKAMASGTFSADMIENAMELGDAFSVPVDTRLAIEMIRHIIVPRYTSPEIVKHQAGFEETIEFYRRQARARGLIRNTPALDFETVRMACQLITGSYLAISFGLQPTVDLVLTVIPQLVSKLRDFTGTTNLRRYGEYSTILPSVNAPPSFYEGLVDREHGFWYDDVKLRIGAMCVFEEPDQLLGRAISFLQGIGVVPLDGAWNLLPFSFVVDWFTNVGQRIAVARNAFRVLYCGKYYFTTFTYKLSSQIPQGALDAVDLTIPTGITAAHPAFDSLNDHGFNYPTLWGFCREVSDNIPSIAGGGRLNLGGRNSDPPAELALSLLFQVVNSFL